MDRRRIPHLLSNPVTILADESLHAAGAHRSVLVPTEKGCCVAGKMIWIWSFLARILLGVAAPAMVTGCGTRLVWDLPYTNTSNLRAPVKFAAECAE